jgi:hypothetical protein
VLEAGSYREMYVSPDWQGRVWGRTNCSFNDDGSGPSNLNGVNGNGAACTTGDCFGRLDCEFTVRFPRNPLELTLKEWLPEKEKTNMAFQGQVPTTLAEFNLIGGMDGKQTFYDISLVDGYNLPLAIIYMPAKNTTWIPPNLTNAACIASSGYLWEPSRVGLAYTNSSYPMPWENLQTNSQVAKWCPWDLQEYPPSKPGDGIYPYPDDDIQRPIFDPCLSACASTNSPQDCCTGEYNDPNVCKPSLYSAQAKAVCPDAYSYAFDDQTSTFIIPTGGGWEVVFCPQGRSTNILETFGAELRALGSSGRVTKEMLQVLTNKTYTESHRPNAAPAVGPVGIWGLMMVLGIMLLVCC